jgi:hypothetical protein
MEQMTGLQKGMQDMMKTQIGSLASLIDAKSDANHESMMVRMDYQLKKMEALETNPEEIESEAEHEEVPKEEAAVETF